jgi:hypothetical protein
MHVVKRSSDDKLKLPLELLSEFSNSPGGITPLMKQMRFSSRTGFRFGLMLVLLAGIVANGCDSGGNVLTPPEGGSAVDQSKPNPTKLKPGTSSRRDREKENAQ